MRRKNINQVNIWPGFVDAITTLLLVFVFLLAIFMISQTFLTQSISGKDAALQSLKTQLQKLLTRYKTFEVIFLDVRLGMENGFELVALLRKHCILTPIIILTAYPSKEVIVEALDHKVDAFIEKPIDFNFLII